MNDFQDLLKLFLEEGEDEKLPTAGPNTAALAKVSQNMDDPKAALQRWAQDHNKEYAVLKARIYTALKLLKECYNTLNDYKTTTAGQARPGQPIQAGDARDAQIASLRSQLLSKFKKQPGQQPGQPTPAQPGGN